MELSWISKLYETYQNCQDRIGDLEDRVPLLPIAHTTQQAQIEVVVDEGGSFIRSSVINRDDATTIIPCTEESSGRTSGPVPHPLFDKLQYVAGDYDKFDGSKKSCYTEYISQLESWCSSPYGNYKVKTLLSYLKKGTLIQDLINDNVLICNDNGKLMDKWTGKKEDAPPIFGVVAGNQGDAFVRFKVEIPGDIESRLWLDRNIWTSYVEYYLSRQSDMDYCYALGEYIVCSDIGPSKIRNAGDKAKLISGNDSSGFTYRGRFEDSHQAARIGYETTQKAHNALKWLIGKQGQSNGSQVILAWGTEDQPVPPICAGSIEVLSSDDDVPLDFFDFKTPSSTREEFANCFNQAISGYGCELDDCAEVVVMGLDAATPGRLSIIYYRELKGSDLLKRVERWHRSCSWLLNYSLPNGTNDKGKTVYQRIQFVGAPSPSDIATTAYGENVADKLKSSVVERLLSCIVDGADVPVDIVRSSARRASNLVVLDTYDASKVLGVACALIRKYYNDKELHKGKEEVWKVSLDNSINNRDYLFGRALAYAQQIESYALRVSDEKRSTNAERLQYQFSLHPAKTWLVICRQLLPYTQKLGPKANKLKSGMNEVISRISVEDFNNEPLSELYLLGYSCQLQAFADEFTEIASQKVLAKEENKGEDLE